MALERHWVTVDPETDFLTNRNCCGRLAALDHVQVLKKLLKLIKTVLFVSLDGPV